MPTLLVGYAGDGSGGEIDIKKIKADCRAPKGARNDGGAGISEQGAGGRE